MPPTTASIILIDLVLAELQAHLPAALASAGLPPVADWVFGDRELVPTARTPQIQVDLTGYSQFGRFGDDMRRLNSIVILAVIAESDPDLMHRYLVGYGDVICAVLESQVAPKLIITAADLSPSFRFQGSSATFRAVAIQAEPPATIHHAGAI